MTRAKKKVAEEPKAEEPVEDQPDLGWPEGEAAEHVEPPPP